MKLAITGDWHLSNYNDKTDEASNLPDRLDKIKTAIYNMVSKCTELGIDHIIIAGDLLHGKSVIYAIAQSVLLDFFRDHKNTKFIIIDGNHDLSGRGNKVVSALKSIDHEPNVTRISEPLKVGNIFFVPFMYDLSKVIKSNSAKYLISHFGLSEGMLNSGISVVSDISVKDLIGKYNTVILGHYHKPQEIIRDDIRVYYTGSPIQLDWGEKGDEKRFLILDTETDEVQSILTEGYRKHFALQINTENKKEIIQKAKELKSQGHNIRLEKVDSVDLKDDIEFRVIDKTRFDNVTNRGITTSMTTDERLKKYLEIKQISKDKASKYLSVGLNIINSCSGVE